MSKIIGKHTSGSLIGSLVPLAGSSAPVGTLLCYGQAVSRTQYAALFAVINITYGAGDGSTTFNLPDARGRTLAGKDNMGGSAANRLTPGGSGITGTTLGAVGGAETHVLSEAQLASHTHVQNAHQHNLNGGAANLQHGGGATAASGANVMGASLGGPTMTAASVTPTNQNTGSNAAHNNTQPTMVANYAIAYI